MKDLKYFTYNFSHEATGVAKFWTYQSEQNLITLFIPNHAKFSLGGYTKEKVAELLRLKIWKEITEAEAALL